MKELTNLKEKKWYVVMNIFDVIKMRKSVRRYLNKPVEDDKLSLILEAGRLAPSAGNRQE